MPRKDTIHDAVKNALVKDGWTVTHDHFESEAFQLIVQEHHIAIVVVETVHEKVIQWIS